MAAGPHILLLCEHPSLNGGEQSYLAVLPEVLSAGFRVTVAAPAGPVTAAFQQAHLETALLDLPPGSAPEQRRARLSAVVQRVKPDVLHANSLAMSRLTGPLAEKMGLPSLGHLRDIVGVSKRAMQDINTNSRLVAVSQATQKFHLTQGLVAEKTRVLYNGVDANRFRKQPPTGYLHRELGLPPEAKLLGAMGQLGARKGLDILLHAAEELLAARPDCHLVLAGVRQSQKLEAVEYEARLHRACGAPPLADRVHFLGFRDDIPRLLNELTLLVHAARQEPLGRVLLEAAATETPLVATAVGGTEEIFPAAEFAAFLAPPDNAAALAHQAGRLLESPTLRTQLASAARARMVSHFSVQRAAAGLIEQYAALV